MSGHPWLLFLDDEREPSRSIEDDDYRRGVGLPPVPASLRLLPRRWTVARSVDEAKELIERLGPPSFVAFDHDLGADLPTGHDLAKWLVEMDLEGRFELPLGFSYEVHSANPVGAANIKGLLAGYLAFRRNRAAGSPGPH